APPTAPPADPGPSRQPRSEAAGSRIEQWQRSGNPAVLPPSASVETFRGAKELREAAVTALREAGAKAGLTGKGTGSLNALHSALSSETLQPHLPGMVSGPLTVPGLHEASLTSGQHADVKVYAKLVNPKLAGLSTGVKMENPTSTSTSTSADVRRTEGNDVVVGGATGGFKSESPATIFSTPGLEFKHGGEVTDADTGGTQNNQVNDLKRDGLSGLVEFDVEYRVVADLGGGRVGVVDLPLPGSAQVRMPEAQALDVLGNQVGPTAKPALDTRFGDLATAQKGVKTAADSWRSAEVAIETARHRAQDAVLAIPADRRQADIDLGRAQGAHTAATADLDLRLAEQSTLENRARAAETDLAEAGRQLDAARADLIRAEQRRGAAQAALDTALLDSEKATQDLKDLVTELTANPDAGRQARLPAAAQDLADADSRAGSARRELAAADQEVQDTRNAVEERTRRHDEALAELATRDQEVERHQGAIAPAREALARAQQGLAAAHAAKAEVEGRAQRVAEELRTALPGLRADADARKREWLAAKSAVDRRIGDFNTEFAQRPTPPR
ncbi:hypothetical protein J7S33_19185, partial [Saccharothrix algeriensis]